MDRSDLYNGKKYYHKKDPTWSIVLRYRNDHFACVEYESTHERPKYTNGMLDIYPIGQLLVEFSDNDSAYN